MFLLLHIYSDIKSIIDLIIIIDVVITEAITNDAITIKFTTLDFTFFIIYLLFSKS